MCNAVISSLAAHLVVCNAIISSLAAHLVAPLFVVTMLPTFSCTRLTAVRNLFYLEKSLSCKFDLCELEGVLCSAVGLVVCSGLCCGRELPWLQYYL